MGNEGTRVPGCGAHLPVTIGPSPTRSSGTRLGARPRSPGARRRRGRGAPSGRTFSVPGRPGAHYRAGPQGLRPAPGPSWQGSCRAAGRATPRLGPRYMRTRIRWPRRSRTPSRCSRPRQLAQDHLRPGGLKELLRHLLGRLDALLLVRGHVILSVWELMQRRGIFEIVPRHCVGAGIRRRMVVSPVGITGPTPVAAG